MGGPVNMVDAHGRAVAVPEEQLADAVAAGYRAEADSARVERLGGEVKEEVYGGVGGQVAALGAGVLRGATLGLSDVAAGALGAGEDLSALKEVNPITSTIGEIGGGIAASVAAPGSALARTPTGVLSGFAARGVESARALGGVRGFVGQAAITGAEAAAQNVGSYLGSVALGDHDLTAEGLGGALGSGFAFGAAGGAAVYGIEKGTIAARRLFSSVMEGGEDATRRAAGEWERRSTEIFDANRATLDEAKRQLDEAIAASQAAKLEGQRAGAYLADERVLAQQAVPSQPPLPVAGEYVPPMTTGRALDDVLAGPGPKTVAPGPEASALDAASRAVDDVSGAPVFAKPAPAPKPGGAPPTVKTAASEPAFGADDYDPFAVAPPPLKPKTSAAQPAAPTGPRPDALASDEFRDFKQAYRDAARRESGDRYMASGLHYSGGSYTEINGALRRGEELTGDVKKTVDGLDAALRMPESSLPREATLYRGLSGDDAKARFASVKPGETLEDPGFLSTAANADSKVRNEDIVFNIHAPAGTKGAPIPSQYSSEQEILLPRGTRLRVDSNELVPQVPNEYRFQEAIAHEILPDKSVRVTSEYTMGGKTRRTTATYPPIREINVTLVPDGSVAGLAPDLAAKAAKIAEATDAESALMRTLQGTKAQIDEGATLGQAGTAANARPLSKAQLESHYDAVMERAAQAADIEAKQALLRQASALEDQLGQLAPSKQALSEIDSVTQAMSRYERAMADVAEEMGDAAHPLTREIADSVRKAESDVDRKMIDRAAQAIDDHAAHGAGGFAKVGEEGVKTGAQQAGGEAFGPAPMPPKERIAYAKARRVEADAAAKRATVAETEARIGYKAAQAQAGDAARATKQAANAVGLPAAASEAAGSTGRALDIGGVLELAGMAGIPGLPRPSDLPIVGPLIGLYLKARAIGGVAGRLMGRVPASGNAKAATLAAQVKDRAAHAVDRMLGHVERTTPAMRTVAAVAGPRLVDAVRDRLHDDGTKAPDNDASLQEHVAARSREITALVADPALIAKQVRREMRDVADPDMVNAAIAFRTNQLKYLDRIAPKEPPPGPFQRTPWKPPRDQATDFARRYAVAMDPVQALEQVEQKSLTPEAAEAYRAVYPKLFAQTQMRLIEKATTLQTKLPRAQLTRMSILFDLPLDSALEPGRLSRTQSVFAATSSQDQGAPPTGPVASIAGPTNLSNIYQTVSDRRAAMR